MPLSPKKIYKQPQIEGASLYDPGDPEKEALPENNYDAPIPGNSTYNNGHDQEKVVLWPQPVEENYTENNTFEQGTTEEKNGEEVEDYHSTGQADQKQEKKKTPEEIAEEILEEKMEQCIQEGYEKGKTKAEKECREMRQEAEAKFKEAEECLQESRRRAQEIVAASENKIVELSVAVAERLLHKQLDINQETITGIVRETLNILNGGEQVEVFVNPAEIDICLEYREKLKEEFTEIIKLDLIADENVSRGSCRVESESGVAEYLLGEEKKQLEQMLLKVAREGVTEQTGEAESVYGRY